MSCICLAKEYLNFFIKLAVIFLQFCSYFVEIYATENEI
ncbi:hypothetical protein Gromo_00514 [Candidatus Gromoviella agglomerans]|nr:hypothetical protein Gromo_00514 [Candidatus Gromoviella agglomerans]